MAADVFISYAWTSTAHREWVRLLAAHLKALGYDVLIDADVEYGDPLSGFMRRITEARHVLLIVNEDYVERANTRPESGVGTENKWISSMYAEQSSTWLSAVFVDNPGCVLPGWLADEKPKGFDFNFDPENPENGPGSEQIEDLWRWLEDLPANRDAEASISTLRKRASRLERHELRTSPAQWRSPDLEGETKFMFTDAPGKTFIWGLGVSKFGFDVSGHGNDSIYVYKDPAQIKAVGIVRSPSSDPEELATQLSPGRSVVAHTGQTIVLMNQHGLLALVDLLEVQREQTGGEYIPAHVAFRWRVLEAS